MKIKTSNLSISFLQRVFGIMRDKNPDMVAGEKKKFVMRPPQVTISLKKRSLKRIHFEEEQFSLLPLMCHALAKGCESGKQENCFCQLLRDCQDAAQAAKGTKFGCFHLFLCHNNISWLICSFQHLLAFLFAELGTSGAIDGSNQLIMKGNSGIFLVFLSGFKKHLGSWAEYWCELL